MASAWPNKRAGLAIAVDLPVGKLGSGETKARRFSVQTTALKPGIHDRAAMTWGTYGVAGRRVAPHGAFLTGQTTSRRDVFAPMRIRWSWPPQAAEQRCSSPATRIAAPIPTPQEQYPRLTWTPEAEAGGPFHRCIDIFPEKIHRAHRRRAGSVRVPGVDRPYRGASSPAAGFLWYGDYNHIDLPFCAKNRKRPRSWRFPHTDYADHRVAARQSAPTGTTSTRTPSNYLYQNEPAAGFFNVTVSLPFSAGRPADRRDGGQDHENTSAAFPTSGWCGTTSWPNGVRDQTPSRNGPISSGFFPG